MIRLLPALDPSLYEPAFVVGNEFVEEYIGRAVGLRAELCAEQGPARYPYITRIELDPETWHRMVRRLAARIEDNGGTVIVYTKGGKVDVVSVPS